MKRYLNYQHFIIAGTLASPFMSLRASFYVFKNNSSMIKQGQFLFLYLLKLTKLIKRSDKIIGNI